MCLVALAIDQSRRFPLVIAANRDEFYDRAAARLAWWTAQEGGPQILAGRDLVGGGTWMGLTAAGRLALVTNVRKPGAAAPDAPSRGAIVPLWLRTGLRPDQFWMQVALSGHAPFNLIAADFHRGECFWASSEQSLPRRIEKGLHGLSNALLDSPWPKVQRLKERVGGVIAGAGTVDQVADGLFSALADRQTAADEHLPDTGLPIDRERALSAAFIRIPEMRYGTRCSTLVITERVNKRLVTHVLERSFGPGPGLALLRRASLRDWPPRYAQTELPRAEDSPVAETEVEHRDPPPLPAVAPRRTRVRSLLKPLDR